MNYVFPKQVVSILQKCFEDVFYFKTYTTHNKVCVRSVLPKRVLKQLLKVHLCNSRQTEISWSVRVNNMRDQSFQIRLTSHYKAINTTDKQTSGNYAKMRYHYFFTKFWLNYATCIGRIQINIRTRLFSRTKSMRPTELQLTCTWPTVNTRPRDLPQTKQNWERCEKITRTYDHDTHRAREATPNKNNTKSISKLVLIGCWNPS